MGYRKAFVIHNECDVHVSASKAGAVADAKNGTNHGSVADKRDRSDTIDNFYEMKFKSTKIHGFLYCIDECANQ
jgi:hypothetical protein